MRRIVHFVQLQAGISDDPRFAGIAGKPEMRQQLNGYILNRSSSVSRGRMRNWCVRMIEFRVFGQPLSNVEPRNRMQTNQRTTLRLQPVGRLVAIPSGKLLEEAKGKRGKKEMVPQQPANAIILRPVQSGESYRITSPPARGFVKTELAKVLETIFERFAREHGFSNEKPLEISLSRGYKANSHGHKEGRAADIDAVEGKSFLKWKQEWNVALSSVKKLDEPGKRAEAIAAEQRRNLGYGLYKAMQAHGGWRVNPGGWRVYRNVMQLFGPWTAIEGPWKAMQIENLTPEDRQRLTDQQWVFQAHQDHIHVAV